MHKRVSKHELQLVESIDEMPMTETHDHIFEVPEVKDRAVIKQIPKTKVQFVGRRVKGSRLASSIPNRKSRYVKASSVGRSENHKG